MPGWERPGQLQRDDIVLAPAVGGGPSGELKRTIGEIGRSVACK